MFIWGPLLSGGAQEQSREPVYSGGKIRTLFDPGIVSDSPVEIVAIAFNPANVGDYCTFNWWDESSPIADSELIVTATSASGTITDDDASANVLTAAAFPHTSVVRIKSTTGTSSNKKYHLVGVAGNNDCFTVTPESSFTSETSKRYRLVSYPARTAVKIKQEKDTNQATKWVWFDEPLWLRNLVLEYLSPGCVVEVYLA